MWVGTAARYTTALGKALKPVNMRAPTHCLHRVRPAEAGTGAECSGRRALWPLQNSGVANLKALLREGRQHVDHGLLVALLIPGVDAMSSCSSLRAPAWQPLMPPTSQAPRKEGIPGMPRDMEGEPFWEWQACAVHTQHAIKVGSIHPANCWRTVEEQRGSPAIIWIFQQRILQGCANELPGVLARRRL